MTLIARNDSSKSIHSPLSFSNTVNYQSITNENNDAPLPSPIWPADTPIHLPSHKNSVKFEATPKGNSSSEQNSSSNNPHTKIGARQSSVDSQIHIRRRTSFMDFGHRITEVSKSVVQKEVSQEAIRFSRTTTAHGIPMILNSTNWFGKIVWFIVTIISIIICVYQCMLVAEKFQRKDKIVNVELQFEQAVFPAVTICNLNPFKHHLARKVPEISETITTEVLPTSKLDAFHQAVSYSKDAAEHYEDAREDGNNAGGRYRRENENLGGFRYVQYEPIMSDCSCITGFKGEKGDCVQKDSIPKSNATLCICNFDRQDSTAWPCFPIKEWQEATCPECNDIGYCNLPETNGSTELPCLCQKNNYCLLRPERLKRIWEIRGSEIPEEGSPFRADFLEQLQKLGYENMTDEVAITTKTKEKMILTMAGLPVHRRIALSYGKAEFIRMCSFNGQQCNIINDFKLHVDPAFGNCYTFNANRDSPLIPSRAGPSYGLRLMVYINASDYLPTTESQGVRIAIHGQAEWPFPDTFGYSAPTGSVSSFGLSMRKVMRLSEPNGDCVPELEPLPPNYIYRNYHYEPEARNCLLVEGIRFTKRNTCQCKHRCTHNVYTTTFSSAKLARGAFRNANCKNNKAGTCFDYDGTNAAMIEIYYEQMSYETLTERESYLFVNMISDIGGQAGLWLGASVITVFEILAFLTKVCAVYFRRKISSSPKHDPNNPKHKISTNSKSYDYGTQHSKPRVAIIKRRPSLISNETRSEYNSEDDDDTTTKLPKSSDTVTTDRPLIEDGNHYEISA
uniref:Uncharacterized protein n=1 Tax=Panagrolaimus sp. PS1159 TaxID=55785 RepID=A0AC35G2G6_9BILA